MKMLKKMAALLLAGVMAMALLTACGDEAPSKSFAQEVEEATVTTFNAVMGDTYKLSNDSALRAKAATMLDKINEEGKIAAKDGVVYDESKTKLTMVLAVNDYEYAMKLNAANRGDTLIDAVKVTAEDLAKLKNPNNKDLIQLGNLFKSMNADVKMGVAAKTMANGDTYLAVAAEFTVKQ